MLKRIFYLAFVVMLFVSCEEYYKPNLDIVPGLLVVESHITNNPAINFARLSMTNDFYNSAPDEKIIGAKVELVESSGLIISGVEQSDGYFTFPKTPVSGRSYMLRINYKEDLYESDSEIMPPVPVIDSLYTKNYLEKYYLTDVYGAPSLHERAVRQISVDAPITPELEYYRFSWRAILEWVYSPPPVSGPGPPPPSWYGWKSLYDAGDFNLAGKKEFSVSEKVKNHTLFTLQYNGNAYLDSAQQVPSGWIVFVDQYGISKGSYDFHDQLNKQFDADGSLFDPVLTQVYGNIHCVNNPNKIVLGYFDLNSFKQYRYFMRLGNGDDRSVIIYPVFRFFDIPDSGYEIGSHPEFWQ